MKGVASATRQGWEASSVMLILIGQAEAQVSAQKDALQKWSLVKGGNQYQKLPTNSISSGVGGVSFCG